jgi:hypothetical protein
MPIMVRSLSRNIWFTQFLNSKDLTFFV